LSLVEVVEEENLLLVVVVLEDFAISQEFP
jgi:hypothetical protein